MAERARILVELVKELLGPRLGPFEILPRMQDPRDEFITGVLAPADIAPEPVDMVLGHFDEGEISGEEDEDGTGGEIDFPGQLSPALDPKALPRSIGLSFTLETVDDLKPEIEVCATWGKYTSHEQGWQRTPRSFLTGPIDATTNRNWPAGDYVYLQLRSSEVSPRVYKISLFLVNMARVRNNHKPEVEAFVFQPQIRVHCGSNTRLIPVAHGISLGTNEDTSMQFLYRGRAAFARGHLCGAVWREIDPELPHPEITSPGWAPFAWTDSVAVVDSERSKFSPADVRTELIPCYAVESPDVVWNDEFGPAPELATDTLSELWEPAMMREALQPLVNGYRAWLDRQEESIAVLSSIDQPTAQAHLQSCRQALMRMEESIDVLCSDSDARLSFCFANKVMSLQSQWVRNRSLNWYPFQLAFILLNLAGLVNPTHPDREICDLLWFPTGGGKTEAYLGLAVFVLALRRRRALQGNDASRGGGVGVLSRYTLRLLTIQQFRRALTVITASELLRVENLDRPDGMIGWRPKTYSGPPGFIWGGMRFSVGLWVGGGVTPNSLVSIGPLQGPDGRLTFIAGALDILRGAHRGYQGPDETLARRIRQSHDVIIEGEPAQVPTCPCCRSILAIPDREGLGPGRHWIHFVCRCTSPPPSNPSISSPPNATVSDIRVHDHDGRLFTFSVEMEVATGTYLDSASIDHWWYEVAALALGQAELLAARPSRPGYFIMTYQSQQRTFKPCNFEIFCPYPGCELNRHAWAEQVPIARGASSATDSGTCATGTLPALPVNTGMQWETVLEWTQYHGNRWIGNRIPIPANTIDDQVYHRCPSMVIATVDKFARLAFEPKAGALFGNVTHYHNRWGYYRQGCPPSNDGNLPTDPQPHPPGGLHRAVRHFLPPELILQDELHLIEGPLGSMVGLYETAVDELSQYRTSTGTVIIPKYIASTATVRQADPQVRALFNRRLAQFPPPALDSDHRFFATDHESHSLESSRPGRLYVGVCSPGRGAQTPLIRIWSSLLQTVQDRWLVNPGHEVDRFWTVVGYFNAIRELAGAESLYRQDIPQRIEFKAGQVVRQLDEDSYIELSSRTDSIRLPGLLDRLKERAPEAPDAVFATSMFSTGVDVDRLGLMIVHGQPKTTASYIQATGRVGRQGGALVVTFFRASRPRDLDHYEFFTGYHRALYRQVEPVTVTPFSPRARERCLGPVITAILRQAREVAGCSVNLEWSLQQQLTNRNHQCGAGRMAYHRYDPEVRQIPEILEMRAQQQPPLRRSDAGVVAREAEAELDRWRAIASIDGDALLYHESSIWRRPERSVVLGDPAHQLQGLAVVYRNAPQSLREVEETTTFRSD